MAGWACRGPRARTDAVIPQANLEWIALRRAEGKTSGGILSDYNNLIDIGREGKMHSRGEVLPLGLWIRHRSGRRTSAWVSFSGATISSREAGAGRCPSRWNGSRHVADLR
jgi:hypothetical protein